MLNPFRVLWSALRDLFEEFLLLIFANIIWAALSLPLFSIAYAALLAGESIAAAAAAMAGVVPAAPAFAGLYALGLRISEGRASKLSDFFAGMRAYAVPAWKLYGIWMAGLVLICFNLGFYASTPGILGGMLIGVFLYLLLLWSALIIYAFPLLVVMEQPTLRLVGRNALVMVLSRPIFTLVTLLLMGLLLLLSSIVLLVPLLLIGAALLSLWGVRATQAIIDFDRARRAAAEEAVAGPADDDQRGRRGQVRPK